MLDCLLRHGVDVPHSCRSGICQTCMMKAVSGQPDDISQMGLKDAQIKQNYFLACSCFAKTDLEVALLDASELSQNTTVTQISMLADDVVALHLKRPVNFEYYPGQFVNIHNPQGIARSYSLASCPHSDQDLVFHIRVIPNGLVSTWIQKELKAGDEIAITEAMGECIYLPEYRDHNLLLLGTGTGLAPLHGILRSALQQQHQGQIYLYHGVAKQEGLYLHSELKTLAQNHDNLHYRPCVTDEAPGDVDIRKGIFTDLLGQDFQSFEKFKVFLCGNPKMVNDTKRFVFLKGASMSDLYSDPFVPSQP